MSAPKWATKARRSARCRSQASASFAGLRKASRGAGRPGQDLLRAAEQPPVAERDEAGDQEGAGRHLVQRGRAAVGAGAVGQLVDQVPEDQGVAVAALDGEDPFDDVAPAEEHRALRLGQLRVVVDEVLDEGAAVVETVLEEEGVEGVGGLAFVGDADVAEAGLERVADGAAVAPAAGELEQRGLEVDAAVDEVGVGIVAHGGSLLPAGRPTRRPRANQAVGSVARPIRVPSAALGDDTRSPGDLLAEPGESQPRAAGVPAARAGRGGRPAAPARSIG